MRRQFQTFRMIVKGLAAKGKADIRAGRESRSGLEGAQPHPQDFDPTLLLGMSGACNGPVILRPSPHILHNSRMLR